MAYFDPSRTILGDWSQDDLKAALKSAQNALILLQSGQRVVTASYGQGEGAQSVTYTQVSRGALEQWILYLRAMTDPTHMAHPRRARLAIF